MEVSDILETFNIAEISLLIRDQINGDEDNFINNRTDHFMPLYYKYAMLTKYDLEEDIVNEAEHRFFSICEVFIEEICKKFKLQLDPEWMALKNSELPAITIALYTFFILDFTQNVYEVILNYIMKNHELVYKTFEDLKNKKDASTLSNKKNLSPEMTIIISNIYDIMKWILLNIDEGDFLDYLENDYIPIQLIKPLFVEGVLTGEFVDTISDMMNDNVTLNSKIGFDFVINVKTGVIKDIFAGK